MRLSDLMSNFGLSGYAEVGLIIFFFVFLAVMVRAFNPKYRAEYEAASCMPLDDELIRTPMQGGVQGTATPSNAAAPKQAAAVPRAESQRPSAPPAEGDPS